MNILLVGANSKGDMIRCERISIYVTSAGLAHIGEDLLYLKHGNFDLHGDKELIPPSVMQASEFSSGKTVSEHSGFHSVGSFRHAVCDGNLLFALFQARSSVAEDI